MATIFWRAVTWAPVSLVLSARSLERAEDEATAAPRVQHRCCTHGGCGVGGCSVMAEPAPVPPGFWLIRAATVAPQPRPVRKRREAHEEMQKKEIWGKKWRGLSGEVKGKRPCESGLVGDTSLEGGALLCPWVGLDRVKKDLSGLLGYSDQVNLPKWGCQSSEHDHFTQCDVRLHLESCSVWGHSL